MAQLNSLVVTGNSKFINDVNANTINLSVNSVGINFRPTHSTYYTTTSYQTSGNEALVFASKNAVTSFMFVNGEDSITNHGDTRWRSLTPGLQIKNNCVSIGQLIDTNVTPSYKLNVYGTSRFADKIYAEYKSNTYVNSLTASAINIPDNSTNGFGGWICGPTKTGRIAIATYQGADEKLYFGWGARGRTENSYEKVMTWEGSTGYLTANKFIGPLQGNADTATTATYANYLNLIASNEIRFNPKPSSATEVCFGYIWADGTSDAKINGYRFMNGNKALTDIQAKYFKGQGINTLLTGTGTAAQDKGSGVSPRYFPARWTFNKGVATPSDGEMITIKIPVAGHDYGVFLSLDNGTTYKPVGLKTQDNGRLTTHFGNGKIITLIYDSTAVVDQVFAAAGADSRTNITGAWKVVTSYLDGNSNTYDRNLYNGTIKCGSTAIVAANIIVGKDGVYHHLKDGTAFDVSYPILYAAGAIAANATGTNNYDIIHFTVTTTQSISLTAYKPVYIKGTLNGTAFTPVSTTPLTQTLTNNDSYYYIYLGNATGTTTIYLQERHPIYVYQNSIIREITGCSDVARTVQNPTIRVTTPNTHYNDAALRYYLSSSSMTTDKPRNLDGKIIHMPWDNDGGYASQMFVTHGPYALAALRCQNGNKDAWGSWMPMGVFSQATPTSGQVVITDGTNGMIKSSGYTIAKSVPSDADFGNTKNTAGSTDTSSKIFLIGATSQAANPQTYSDDQVYTTSGTLQTNITKATTIVNANSGGSGTAGGLALYSDANPEVYGVMFRTTANSGKHGYVQSDWATYFTMNSGATTRGWVYRLNQTGNVASISGAGNAVFNGSVTVGGNSANTSGGRMEYNATNHCIDFIVT